MIIYSSEKQNIASSCSAIYAIMFSKYFHIFSSNFIGGDCSAAPTSVQPSFYGVPARRAGKRLSPALPPPGYRSDNHDRQYLVTAELSVYHHRLFHARRAKSVPAIVADPLVATGFIGARPVLAAADKSPSTL